MDKIELRDLRNSIVKKKEENDDFFKWLLERVDELEKEADDEPIKYEPIVARRIPR